MKILYSILRLLIGSFFIFSGFVKAVDTKGTEYKLHEYFTLDNSVLNIPFLANNALYISVFFVIFELLLGVFLLLGLWKKFTLPSFLLTIIFFSFLTFYSAYYKKVTDCGCFGDFMKFEPWTSFYKDIILLIFILFLFIFHKNYDAFFKPKISYIVVFLSLIFSIFIVYLGINHNPLLDFRPFAVGKKIQDGMKGVPEDRRQIYILRNSKTKEVKKMDSKTYSDTNIWEDSLWVLDEKNIKDSVFSEGIKPKINGFFITTKNGDETEKYLNTNRLLLIVFPENEYCSKGVQNVYTLLNSMDISHKKQIEILCLASKQNVLNDVNSGIADDKIMKAMVRSTPGILLLSKGKVIAKYHFNDIPESKEIYKLFNIK